MAFRGPYRESGNSITNNQMLSRRFSFHLSLPLSLAKLKDSRDALNWAMPLCWPLCILATCVAASEDAVTTCHQLGCCVGVSLSVSEMIQRFIEINNFSFKFNLLCSQQSPLTHNYSINRSSKYIRYQLSKYEGFHSHYLVCRRWLYIILWQGPQTFFGTHDNQPPLPSGVHGFKDFLCSAYLLGSFDGRIYSLKHSHNCKFVQQRIQEDEHYRENP